jgi:hypothetical protein
VLRGVLSLRAVFALGVVFAPRAVLALDVVLVLGLASLFLGLVTRCVLVAAPTARVWRRRGRTRGRG